MSKSPAQEAAPAPKPTIIKKYANRRLYHTAKSTYVTLDDLCEMVKAGEDFVVQDAKSGEDLTRQVLTQIIAEQETGGQYLLPTRFLRQLISYYGGQGQQLLPGYLAYALEQFANNQEQMYSYLSSAFGNALHPFTLKDMPGWDSMIGASPLSPLNNAPMSMWDDLWRNYFNHAASWLNPLAHAPSAANQGLGAAGQMFSSFTTMQRNLAELNDQIQTLSQLKKIGDKG